MEHPVLIDTSLDTHILLTFSDTDTVSDLKQKILVEHPICFPRFGEIEITAVKLKLGGNDYHLADSVHIKVAFKGLESSGFLHVDASSLLHASPHVLPQNEVSAGGAPKDAMQHDVHEITQVSVYNSPVTKKRKADDPVEQVAKRNIPCSSVVDARGLIARDVEKMEAYGEPEKRATEPISLSQKINESQGGSGNIDGMRQTDVVTSAVQVQEKDQDLGRKCGVAVDTEKQLVVYPISESSNLQRALKVNQSRGSKSVSRGGNFRTMKLLGSLLRESGKPPLQSNRKALKVSGSKMTPACSSNSLKLNPPSGTNVGEVMKKTPSNKSLLATSRAIFKDDSSKSSSSEQAGVDSDARTRTLNTLSSSDEESDASLEVSDSFEGEEDGRSSQIFSPVPKGMKLDSILRCSSRFKKFNLSALQSQPEDSASSFVPDNEANS